MAIMAVKIDDTATLRMNEFFDFGGMCYAISRPRSCSCAKAADLEDFYECTVLTDWIEDVPVVFLCQEPQADGKGEYICGWYRQAKIYRRVLHPSLFLEGNIEARALDAVLLAPERRIPADKVFSSTEQLFREKNYKVIEEDDSCHDRVLELILGTDIAGVPVRYALYDVNIDRAGLNAAGNKDSRSGQVGNKHTLSGHAGNERSGHAGNEHTLSGHAGNERSGHAGNEHMLSGYTGNRRLPAHRDKKTRGPAHDTAAARYEFCINRCMEYAGRLMRDGCEHIGEIKSLKEYARLAQVYGAKYADGYYYEAMADEQLGFIREGLKIVNKALALEPDGADLMAQKANLLVAYGNYEDALALYAESFDISGDESYLMMKGVVYFIIGNVDAAYKAYRQIGDKTLLEDAGINLKDMERRWPFIAIRGLKNLLKLK